MTEIVSSPNAPPPPGKRCYGAARNCTEPPAYEWTGPHGGKYLLCVRHCAEWRVQTAATPLEPTHIGSWHECPHGTDMNDAGRGGT